MTEDGIYWNIFPKFVEGKLLCCITYKHDVSCFIFAGKLFEENMGIRIFPRTEKASMYIEYDLARMVLTRTELLYIFLHENLAILSFFWTAY